jgi:5'-3' exonuclease
VIAAAARLTADWDTTVASSDKDLYQLLWLTHVALYDTRHKTWVNTADVSARFGVKWEYWQAFRALVGDASDGLSGIKGCGEKRAIQALQEAEVYYRSHEKTGCLALQKPATQLRYVAEAMAAREERNGWQAAIADGYATMERILQVMDLSDSFGGTTGLARAMRVPMSVDDDRFMLMCRRLGFRSILADRTEWLRPFHESVGRRVPDHDLSLFAVKD